MQFIRGIHQLTSKHRPSVVSIGNYDGVHLGHQELIKTLLKSSEKLSLPSTVVTFEPLAKEFFMPDSVARISSVEQRAEQLFFLGVDQVLSIDFNAEFASLTPSEFVQQVLVNGLGVRFLCIGDDFRFGKNREGDFEFLKSFGANNGFTVQAHKTFMIDGQRVSSGRVRAALGLGDIRLAETLLGRPYSISGVVSLGQQLGRTIGFPTANIVLPNTRFAVNGVYAIRAVIENIGEYQGVANIGVRPTVDGKENRLEVHLFDFDVDIYDKNMDVQLLSKIREEQKFDSLDDLQAQIELDVAAARAICQKTRE